MRMFVEMVYAHFAVITGGSNLQEKFLVFRVSGVLGQFLQDVGTRRGGDVDIVGERRTVGGGTREGGFLCSCL